MSQHILPLRTYFLIFASLLGLLLLTVGAAYVDLGRFNHLTAMAIATLKAVLILLYFMHVKFSSKLTWIFSGAAFFWLFIFFALGFNDYLTRDWLPIPGK